MHREIIEQHLAEAEQHLADGQRHIENQRQIIAALESRGRDTAVAKDLLATMLETQILHEQNFELILRELDALAG